MAGEKEERIRNYSRFVFLCSHLETPLARYLKPESKTASKWWANIAEVIERHTKGSFTVFLLLENRTCMPPMHFCRVPILPEQGIDGEPCNCTWAFTCAKRWGALNESANRNGLDMSLRRVAVADAA